MSTGDVRVWYLDGPVVIGQGAVAKAGGPWNIVGVGDFNGDGNPDIVWRNSATGETVVWYMQGVLRLGAEALQTLPPPWNIIKIGDFGGDAPWSGSKRTPKAWPSAPTAICGSPATQAPAGAGSPSNGRTLWSLAGLTRAAP